MTLEQEIATIATKRLREQEFMISQVEGLLRRYANSPAAFCLRSYSFEEGPAPAKGRRRGESISAFYRRVQAAELAATTKGIFAPVKLSYNHRAETNRRLASYRTAQMAPYSAAFRASAF